MCQTLVPATSPLVFTPSPLMTAHQGVGAASQREWQVEYKDLIGQHHRYLPMECGHRPVGRISQSLPGLPASPGVFLQSGHQYVAGTGWKKIQRGPEKQWRLEAPARIRPGGMEVPFSSPPMPGFCNDPQGRGRTTPIYNTSWILMNPETQLLTLWRSGKRLRICWLSGYCAFGLPYPRSRPLPSGRRCPLRYACHPKTAD